LRVLGVARFVGAPTTGFVFEFWFSGGMSTVFIQWETERCEIFSLVWAERLLSAEKGSIVKLSRADHYSDVFGGEMLKR
jgi:hypothetical protein